LASVASPEHQFSVNGKELAEAAARRQPSSELHEVGKRLELARSFFDLLQVRPRVSLDVLQKAPGNPLDVVGGEELAAETLRFVVGGWSAFPNVISA
jgi:hypothetical protein